MPFDRIFLDELSARNDIVDVVSQYVQLKKSGANYFGLCPFHNEKTGSFSVSPDQLNIGKGGNTPLCPFDCDCCFFSVCWIMRLWEGKRPAVLLHQGSLFVNSLIPLTECQQFGELSPFHFSVSALLVSE